MKKEGMLLKKIICLLAVVLIFASILSGCSLWPFSSSDKTVLTLTNADPYTLDPAAANESLSAGYILQIFSGLLKFDSNLEPVPDIAESMPDISPDGLTYTFHLRRDVKFQNGAPVTAADFQYSWERAASPATNSPTAGTYLGDIVGVNDVLTGKAKQISGVSVIDDYTLELTIDSPKSYFLYKLTYPPSFVVQKNNVSSGANWWQKPVGTGPFKMQEWVKGESFILARNDRYYGDKAKIDRVRMVLNSTNSDMDLFETGQVDIASPSVAYYDRITDRDEPFYNQLYISPELSIDYIGFNCRQSPFDDASIRKAFSLAIDKGKIVSLIYREMANKAAGILPPGMPGYNEELSGLEFDINQARELIKASKYGDVSQLPQVTLTVPGAGGYTGPMVQALVYQWKQNLGVDVNVRQLEPEVYNSGLPLEMDQMYYFGWIADYPSPQDFLDILFSSGSSYNYGGYSNPAADSLIQQANQESDQNRSLALYRQAEQQIVNDAPCMPLTFGENYLLVKPYVQNLSVNALGFMDFTGVTISPH